MKIGYALAIIGVFALAGVGLFYFLSASAGTNVGDRAINISFTTIDGSTFELNSHRGKVVIVDFITTSCPVCVEEFKALKQLVDDERVSLVSVNLDTNSLSYLKEFSSYYDLGWDVGNSRQAGVDYKVSAVPTVLVIDKEGVIRYRNYYTELTQLQQMISEYSK